MPVIGTETRNHSRYTCPPGRYMSTRTGLAVVVSRVDRRGRRPSGAPGADIVAFQYPNRLQGPWRSSRSGSVREEEVNDGLHMHDS